jgi:hypothetical protein
MSTFTVGNKVLRFARKKFAKRASRQVYRKGNRLAVKRARGQGWKIGRMAGCKDMRGHTKDARDTRGTIHTEDTWKGKQANQ